jgi:hypothetical protein
MGFSHIDYIYFEEIVVNGQKLIRKKIMDAYPNHNSDDSGKLDNPGGPRITSMDQVITRAVHSRAVIAYRDPLLFRKAFLEEIRDRIVASDLARELHERGAESVGNRNSQIREIKHYIQTRLSPSLQHGAPIDAQEIWKKIYWEPLKDFLAQKVAV